MTPNELIQQARELCWKASTEKANGNSVDSAALSWAIAQSIVPRLCDALEATTARAERAELERDEYRAALQNWHEDGLQEAGKGEAE